MSHGTQELPISSLLARSDGRTRIVLGTCVGGFLCVRPFALEALGIRDGFRGITTFSHMPLWVMMVPS